MQGAFFYDDAAKCVVYVLNRELEKSVPIAEQLPRDARGFSIRFILVTLILAFALSVVPDHELRTIFSISLYVAASRIKNQP